jgi:hypothetical protein
MVTSDIIKSSQAYIVASFEYVLYICVKKYYTPF